MRTQKILAIVALTIAALTSCNRLYKDVASQAEVDNLKKELNDMRTEHNNLQKQYIDQNAELSAILDELAFVTGRTSKLRVDVEKGSARMTQAEQISIRINALKERITELEKSNNLLNSKSREFERIIAGFNKVITEQESQIKELRAEIESKNRTIRNQSDTINFQNKTILDQRDALQQKVEEQAAMLFKAGQELESLGDSSPKVTWRKNKQKVEDMQQSLYRSAMNYYNMALESGYDAKESIYLLQLKLK